MSITYSHYIFRIIFNPLLTFTTTHNTKDAGEPRSYMTTGLYMTLLIWLPVIPRKEFIKLIIHINQKDR